MSNTVSFIEQDLISNDVCKKLVSLFKESPNVLPTYVPLYLVNYMDTFFKKC